jgi:hypothetical protein
MIFADVRLRGVMDGIDLAREVKMRWPLLPVILTSGHPRERVGELPPSVAYMPKPWQPLNGADRRRAGASISGVMCGVSRPARALCWSSAVRVSDVSVRNLGCAHVFPKRSPHLTMSEE